MVNKKYRSEIGKNNYYNINDEKSEGRNRDARG
jgi:hypothetical protein